jgi:hypothetical protein
MTKYSNEEIQLLEGLCVELVESNNELNSKIIIMDRFVKDREAKIKMLTNQLYQCLNGDIKLN